MTTSLVLLLVTGLLLLGGLVTLQVLDRRRWRHTLQAFRLHLPRQLTVDDAVHWLGTIAATTHPPRGSLLPLAPVALEVVATQAGIAHYVLVDASTRGKLLAGVRAALPGARLDETPEYLHASTTVVEAREFTLTSRIRPLAVERTETVSASLLAALQPLGPGERLIV